MHRERTLKEVTRRKEKRMSRFSLPARDGRAPLAGHCAREGLTARGHETTLLISHKKSTRA